MLYCPNCGTNNTQDTKFCTNCGQKLYSITEEAVFEQETLSPIVIPKTQEKMNNHFGIVGKVLIGIVVLFAVGVIFLLAFDSGTHTPSDKEIVEREEININTSKTEDKKEVELDVSTEISAEQYRYGIDVQPNQYKAFELYKKLADKGDLNAMVELADYYEQGIWVKKDTKKAIKLLQKAADDGSLAAKWQLEFLESEK